MNKPTKLQTGNHGENLATEYLLAKGYTILERNWRYQKAELDIIAQHSSTTVFVEVKTRRGLAYGYPEEGVTPTKQKHLARGANAYVLENDINNDLRFDIISIILTKGKAPEINHIEDAFFPVGEGY